MIIKQLSAFIENKPGRLANVTRTLAEGGINIHAISIADTSDFGILRLIVDKPTQACEILKNESWTVKLTDVIAVALEHHPGSLAGVLEEITRLNLSVEYMYAFTSRSKVHDAMVILRLDKQDDAVEALKTSENIKLIGSEVFDELDYTEK